MGRGHLGRALSFPFWVSVSLFGVLVLCPSLHTYEASTIKLCSLIASRNWDDCDGGGSAVRSGTERRNTKRVNQGRTALNLNKAGVVFVQKLDESTTT